MRRVAALLLLFYLSLVYSLKNQSATPLLREITEINYQSLVDQDEKKPVLLEFYADWSPDCRAFERNLGRIAKRLKDEAFVGKINFNKQRDLVEQFGVTYPPPLPQFILVFKDAGSIKYEGPSDVDSIVAFVLGVKRPNVTKIDSENFLSMADITTTPPHAAVVLLHPETDSDSLTHFTNAVRPLIARQLRFYRITDFPVAQKFGLDIPSHLWPQLAVIKDADLWKKGKPEDIPVFPDSSTRRKDYHRVRLSDKAEVANWIEEHRKVILNRELSDKGFKDEDLFIAAVSGEKGLEDPYFASIYNKLRRVAHLNRGVKQLHFVWLNGVEYEEWLLKRYKLNRSYFGNYVFAMKSLYKEYFDGINANSEDDIINYLKDVKEGRYTKRKIGEKTMFEELIKELRDLIPSLPRDSEGRVRAVVYTAVVGGIVLSILLYLAYPKRPGVGVPPLRRRGAEESTEDSQSREDKKA